MAPVYKIRCVQNQLNRSRVQVCSWSLRQGPNYTLKIDKGVRQGKGLKSEIVEINSHIIMKKIVVA